MIKKIRLFKKNKEILSIVLLIIISGFFRFLNLNWDMGNFFHPDERNIANAVAQIRFFSQLNPNFFAYGGLPVYLYRFIADLIFFITKDAMWISSWSNINLIGRFFSAFFSTVTIVPLYLLAKTVFDKKVAIISACLFTFTVASIQTAHYAVTESFITLIGVLTCYFSIKIVHKLNLSNSIILGLILGVGVAAKTSALSFFILPFFTYLIVLIKRSETKKKIFASFVTFSITCSTIFLIFSPYTFLSFTKFMESMNYESGVVSGVLPVVYTLQFDHTVPYLFQIINLFWQLGPVALLSIIGFVFTIINVLLKREKKLFIFLIFPLVYFLYVGSWHTKFIRYMMPIIPFLLIMAGAFLIEIRKHTKILGNVLLTIFIFSGIFWAFAFSVIYTKPQTRILASDWIYKNIPEKSTIITEHWDDGLPISNEKFNTSRFQINQLAIYEPDDNDKIIYLALNLADSDYIVLNSRRLYGTLINLRDKYPITSRYYKLLFAGKLGYNKVAEFTSYPSFLGFTFNDDLSEETFQVYDHPKVLIFKNVENYNREMLSKLIGENN